MRLKGLVSSVVQDLMRESEQEMGHKVSKIALADVKKSFIDKTEEQNKRLDHIEEKNAVLEVKLRESRRKTQHDIKDLYRHIEVDEQKQSDDDDGSVVDDEGDESDLEKEISTSNSEENEPRRAENEPVELESVVCVEKRPKVAFYTRRQTKFCQFQQSFQEIQRRQDDFDRRLTELQVSVENLQTLVEEIKTPKAERDVVNQIVSFVETKINDNSKLFAQFKEIQNDVQGKMKSIRFETSNQIKDCLHELQEVRISQVDVLEQMSTVAAKMEISQGIIQQAVKNQSKATETPHSGHEKELNSLQAQIRAIQTGNMENRREIREIKGPLVTAARNMKEECIAVLAELQRHQETNRTMILDFQKVSKTPPTVLKRPPSALGQRSHSLLSLGREAGNNNRTR